MADTKISDLTQLTALEQDDLFVVVEDSSGTTKKIVPTDIFGSSSLSDFNDYSLSGGTHGTSVTLTSPPFSTIAVIKGLAISQNVATITYTDNTTNWVIFSLSTSGNLANFVRVVGTHYLVDSISGATPPALPADSVWLMQVITAAGQIVTVHDARTTEIYTGILRLDTIAALRAKHSLTAIPNSVIFIRSHTTIGDRGEGVFWYDATATGMDNDGTLITPVDNPAIGRWRRLVPGNYISIDWFGAYLAANATPAIANAIASFLTPGPGPLPGEGGGGLLVAGEGLYTCTTRININRSITFRGAHSGTSQFWPGTIFEFPAGTTGIKLEGHAVGQPTDASWTTLADFSVRATAKNATETTGSITDATNTLTLAAAQDFIDGQVVQVVGAGGAARTMQGTTGSTTIGSAVVSLFDLAGAALDPAGGGIHTDMRLTVAGAGFPADSFVVSLGATSVTMSQNATANITQGVISWQPDLYAEIVSGGGTVNLVLDLFAEATVAGAKVKHGDCGILVKAVFQTDGFLDVRSFQGPGIYIACQGTNTPVEAPYQGFANNFRLGQGRSTNNRMGILVKGRDCNNGICLGFDVMDSVEYGLSDESNLGCHWHAMHVSGPYAYRTWSAAANASFFGSYVEGGGGSTFEQRTLIVGGIMPAPTRGGARISAESARLIFGGFLAGEAGFTHHTLRGPQGLVDGLSSALALRDLRGGDTWDLRRMLATVGGTWWALQGNSIIARTALWWSDTDTSGTGNDPGHLWFPRGYYIGDGATHNGTLTNARRHTNDNEAGGGPPAAGTWVRGDIVFNSAPTAGTRGVGWICTTGGTPGTWKAFGDIDA